MIQAAYLQALTAIFLWSTLAFLGQKVSAVPPFLLVGVTLFLGGLCSIPWFKQWRITVKSLALGIFGLFGYHFCLFMAFKLAPAIEVNLINYLWPLLIVLLSPLFFTEVKLTKNHIMGSVLGFCGALFIVTSKGQLTVSKNYGFGYVLAAMAALIWASYSLLSKKVKDVTTPTVGLFCLVSGVLSLICHFIFEEAFLLNTSHLWPIIALGLGPMGTAFYLWDAALKKGDPRVIGSLSYLTPLLSTVLIVFLAHEKFTMTLAIAMVLIVGGALIGAKSKK